MKIKKLKVNILLSIFALFKTNIHIHLVVHSVNIQTLSDENYYNALREVQWHERNRDIL